jgi:spermidine dehydrogenase
VTHDSGDGDDSLGMNRPIARRDFLCGAVLGMAGPTYAGGIDPSKGKGLPPAVASSDYPPALTGLRGQYPGLFETAHAVRDGLFADVAGSDTGEEYDLVVVGGGISGLAAAHFFRCALGADRKVLILDNHDDFGGHAKRNEFEYEGRTYLGYGGTMSPKPSTAIVKLKW